MRVDELTMDCKKEEKMTLDFCEYNTVFTDDRTIFVYGGPLWANGLYSIAEVLKQYLDMNDKQSNTASVFAVFIEQMNNMLIHSAEKESINHPDGHIFELPKGSFILGIQDGSYFIQTGNVVAKENADMLKERIDYLNSLEKKELMCNYKKQAKNKGIRLGDRGAGIGLIEIAWRATSKIKYEFMPDKNDMVRFTMHVTV